VVCETAPSRRKASSEQHRRAELCRDRAERAAYRELQAHWYAGEQEQLVAELAREQIGASACSSSCCSRDCDHRERNQGRDARRFRFPEKGSASGSEVNVPALDDKHSSEYRLSRLLLRHGLSERLASCAAGA
jgi:hypothetical protein